MSKDVIISASFYKQKYFYNEKYDLPKQIKDDLKRIAITTAESIQGIFIIGLYTDGSIYLEAMREEDDFNYDDINAKLIVREVEDKNLELFDSISKWFIVKKELGW